MLAQPLGGGDVGTRRRKGDERGVGKRRRKGKRGASGGGFATCKEQGAWAERCFMARVRQIGLAGLKPHGDSTLYDVGIEHKGRLARLQVKSTTFIRERTLTCNMVGPGGNRTSEGCRIPSRCTWCRRTCGASSPFRRRATRRACRCSSLRKKRGTNMRRIWSRGICCGSRRAVGRGRPSMLTLVGRCAVDPKGEDERAR